MDGSYLDYGSIDEIWDELLRLRQENKSLRDRVSCLENGLKECYEHINIDKMPDSDYDSWLENDYNDDELDIDYDS